MLVVGIVIWRSSLSHDITIFRPELIVNLGFVGILMVLCNHTQLLFV